MIGRPGSGRARKASISFPRSATMKWIRLKSWRLIETARRPPLEGEGRLTLSAAKCETGWGEGLSTRALFEGRDRHPTPPLISFASTLPLQGRVRKLGAGDEERRQ